MHPHPTIPQKANNPTGLQNPSAWARNDLGMSFASFGQAKEDKSYMPICRSYGFIYDSPTSKYVAHELAHGAFALHHTFSSESESYHAPQGTTPNLMYYSGGTALNHLQWQWMHESHTNLLGFLDDESEGEGKTNTIDYTDAEIVGYVISDNRAYERGKKSPYNIIKTNILAKGTEVELLNFVDASKTVVSISYFESGAGKYPDYILNTDKTAYRDSWNHSIVTLLCHLSHWTTASGWQTSGVSYENTKGEWMNVLYEYILNFAKKFGEKIDDNIYKWDSKYKLLDRLSEFGCEKPIGKTKLDELWTSEKLEIKKDIKEVKHAVKSDNTYIINENCVIIGDGGVYLVITKDAEEIKYETFE